MNPWGFSLPIIKILKTRFSIEMTDGDMLDEDVISGITKPSLQRLARQAGVKTMAADCSDILRKLLADEAERVCCAMLIFNEQRNTRTIMLDDLYPAIQERGCRLATSSSISASICSAKG